MLRQDSRRGTSTNADSTVGSEQPHIDSQRHDPQFEALRPLHTLNTVNMSGIPPSPRFYQQPLRYLKWASYNKPAYFYSIIIGSAGPILVLTVPPIRRYLGEEPIPKIPLTYPVPKGQRPRPAGFDDE